MIRFQKKISPWLGLEPTKMISFLQCIIFERISYSEFPLCSIIGEVYHNYLITWSTPLGFISYSIIMKYKEKFLLCISEHAFGDKWLESWSVQVTTKLHFNKIFVQYTVIYWFIILKVMSLSFILILSRLYPW